MQLGDCPPRVSSFSDGSKTYNIVMLNNMKIYMQKKAGFMKTGGRQADPCACPPVSIAGPQQCHQVESEKCTQQGQHHIVLIHSGKQLCSAGYVDVVWHHKEGAPKDSEVITETLRSLRSAFFPHLRKNTTHD